MTGPRLVVMVDEHREYGTATAVQLLRELRATQGTTLHEYRHLHPVATDTPPPHESHTPVYRETPGRA